MKYLLLLLCVSLGGCGYKGALYLPAPSKTPPVTPSAAFTLKDTH